MALRVPITLARRFLCPAARILEAFDVMRSLLKKALRSIPLALMCAAVMISSTGCLGLKVFNETVTHVPASDLKVELRLKTSPTADILVIYDDLNSTSEKTERRAFYLFANEKRICHGRRPEFVQLSEARTLQPVPVFQKFLPDALTNELYAVEETSHHFKLESRDHIVTEFTLPEYDNWLTAKKLFIFPAAVGADAVAFGAIAAASNPGAFLDTSNGATRSRR